VFSSVFYDGAAFLALIPAKVYSSALDAVLILITVNAKLIVRSV